MNIHEHFPILNILEHFQYWIFVIIIPIMNIQVQIPIMINTDIWALCMFIFCLICNSVLFLLVYNSLLSLIVKNLTFYETNLITMYPKPLPLFCMKVGIHATFLVHMYKPINSYVQYKNCLVIFYCYYYVDVLVFKKNCKCVI